MFTTAEFRDAEIKLTYPGLALKDRPARRQKALVSFDFQMLEPDDINRRSIRDVNDMSTCELSAVLPDWDFSHKVALTWSGVKTRPTNPKDVMGAGVVKLETGPNGISIHTGRMDGNNMPQYSQQTSRGQQSGQCEECSTLFAHHVKQIVCKDCSRTFCQQCTLSTGASFQCQKCNTLLSGNFTREQLIKWRVKDLKALLVKENINISKCKEKDDLIEIIFRHYGNSAQAGRSSFSGSGYPPSAQSTPIPPETVLPGAVPDVSPPPSNHSNTPSNLGNQSSNQPGMPSNMAGNQGSPRMQGAGSANNASAGVSSGQTEPPRQSSSSNLEEEEKKDGKKYVDNPNIKLDDIQTEEEIDQLNIRSLKKILLNNFVDYKGCCEKWEFQDRLKRLWRDNEANKKKAEEQRKISENPSSIPAGPVPGEDDICKICMDAAIDCVLLECGHMITCTQCGKRLSECPMCRQYVVRAVHIFKS